MKLLVRRLHPDAVLPQYIHIGDAGCDLVVVEGGTLQPGEMRDFPCGWAVEPPLGYFFDIRPRSSTLRKRGLLVHTGTIDNGYRGPLFVYAWNVSDKPVVVEPGDRLAQMVLLPYTQPVVVEVEVLTDSDRGEGGFGSTGLQTFIGDVRVCHEPGGVERPLWGSRINGRLPGLWVHHLSPVYRHRGGHLPGRARGPNPMNNRPPDQWVGCAFLLIVATCCVVVIMLAYGAFVE